MIMTADYAKLREVVTCYAKPTPSADDRRTFETSCTHRIETLL